jgi:hypothetical protein
MESKNRSIVIVGQARLPRGLFEQEILQLIVELDSGDGRIMEMAVTPSLPLVEKFLRRQMIGLHLVSGTPSLIRYVQEGLIYRGSKAILAAMTDVVRKHGDFLQALAIPRGDRSGPELSP